MMSARAREVMEARQSSSFACDLKAWTKIMEAYENGGHAYLATMPTDSLRRFRDIMLETKEYGFARLKDAQAELGERARALFAERGVKSVAAPGFEAPGVVVCYTNDPDVKNGSKFAKAGMQIAAGVPLAVDEGPDYSSFRIGLFGLDKLYDVDRAVGSLETALDAVL
jgi:aspartate aminotransferase-like enzyme